MKNGLRLNLQHDLEAPQEREVLRPAPPTSAPLVQQSGVSGPKAQISKEVVRLVQQLFVPALSTAPVQTIVVASVEEGSGSSWVCARIAEFLASHIDGSVCLVDANPHSASAKAHFGLPNSGRVLDSEWLFSPVRRANDPAADANLWLLSYRPTTEGWLTPATLERFQARLSELRKDFNYILIDAPPINAYADASLFGRMADGLVMVVEAHKTRREPAQRAKKVLDAAGVTVLGAVLNKRTFPIPGFLYKRL
jgi:Mrp family chromosome partitioning ATPase